MYRSGPQRGDPRVGRNRKITAVAIVLVVFAALVTVSRVSSAKVQRVSRTSASCGPAPVAGAKAPNGQSVTTTVQNGRTVRNHWGDGQDVRPGCPGSGSSSSSPSGAPASSPAASAPAAGGASTVNCPLVSQKLGTVPAAAKATVDQNLAALGTQIAAANKQLATAGAGRRNTAAVLAALKAQRTATITRIADAIDRVGPRPTGLTGLSTCTVVAGNGGAGGSASPAPPTAAPTTPAPLDILANNCKAGSKLGIHTGFQLGDKCVATEMGEVANADQNPSLLITDAPRQVGVNQPFTIKVSTRNLVRDRFLAAGQGGYYVEMSLLTAQGLVRGHFHTACRMLTSTNAAPDPAPVPAFFVATEDKSGGATPDTIVINVPGLPTAGTAQCASWAGDGSHRIPMMQRANQIPAFDSVRVQVN
ncbi:MAG: hypothetical protein QOE03_2297 [Micromonosporaceae bacterium]|nr:hypothetical protein [Micromonosporaceae bacterium]